MEWKIGKSRGCCSACEGELEAGKPFYSVLNEWEGGLERCDYCLNCWGSREQDKNRATFFWRTVQAEAPKKRAIDLGMVTDLFRKLPESEEPMRQKVRYFLALLLMRKRAVKLLNTGREDGREFMLIQLKGEESPLRVINPDLTPGELDDVKAELEALMEMELSGK